jgi:hypothetical protein
MAKNNLIFNYFAKTRTTYAKYLSSKEVGFFNLVQYKYFQNVSFLSHYLHGCLL